MKQLSHSKHRQKGDFLIEATIGVLLMSIVALGIMHAAGRSTAAQAELKEQTRIFDTIRGGITAVNATQRDPAVANSLCSQNVQLNNNIGADDFSAVAIKGCNRVTASLSIPSANPADPATVVSVDVPSAAGGANLQYFPPLVVSLRTDAGNPDSQYYVVGGSAQ